MGARPGATGGEPDLTHVTLAGASSLGEYLVPRSANAPDVTVEFVDVSDDVINPLGVKGVGEIGQVGVAAAIANAIFHAIGRRSRQLPLTPEFAMDSVAVFV